MQVPVHAAVDGEVVVVHARDGRTGHVDQLDGASGARSRSEQQQQRVDIAVGQARTGVRLPP
eukprot:13917659-Alexandrium_andersonii.AAC.1